MSSAAFAADEAPAPRWQVRSVTASAPNHATYFDPELKKPFFLSEGSSISEDCLICLEDSQVAVDLVLYDEQGGSRTERISGPVATVLANVIQGHPSRDYSVTQVLVQEGSVEAYQQLVLAGGRRVDVSRTLIRGEKAGGKSQQTEANKIRINPCGYSVSFYEPQLELTSMFEIYPTPEEVKPKPETTGEIPKAEVADTSSTGK